MVERLISRSSTAAPRGPEPQTELAFDGSPVVDETDGNPPQSVATRVLEFLNQHPGRTYTVADIGKGIGAVNLKSLRGALSRLASPKEKKIGKYGRGKYRAKPAAPKETIPGSIPGPNGTA